MELSLVDKIRRCAWDNGTYALPEELSRVPCMLTGSEKRMLHWLARHAYSGRGAICELGPFLGGSTVHLANGLPDTTSDGVLHCFDAFNDLESERAQETWLRKWGIGEEAGYNGVGLFQHFTAKYERFVRMHRGFIEDSSWCGEPIEILFQDVAKTWASNDAVLKEFFPSLIPGESIVIQQDYLWRNGCTFIPIVMEKLSANFEMLSHTWENSVVFLCTKQVESGHVEGALSAALEPAERLWLAEAAIERFHYEYHREIMRKKLRVLRTELGMGAS